MRSSAFAETPPSNEGTFGGPSVPRRDERLALIEDLEPGPVEHTPPFDDPEFMQLEPNSGIRLMYVFAIAFAFDLTYTTR